MISVKTVLERKLFLLGWSTLRYPLQEDEQIAGAVELGWSCSLGAVGRDLVHVNWMCLETRPAVFVTLPSLTSPSERTAAAERSLAFVRLALSLAQVAIFQHLLTQPRFGPKLHLSKEVELIQAPQPHAVLCNGSSSPPTLGWNQRRENLTIVSKQQSSQELLQKHVQLAWVAVVLSFPREPLLPRAGGGCYSHGSRETSGKEWAAERPGIPWAASKRGEVSESAQD